jgi:hypothetical protein
VLKGPCFPRAWQTPAARWWCRPGRAGRRLCGGAAVPSLGCPVSGGGFGGRCWCWLSAVCWLPPPSAIALPPSLVWCPTLRRTKDVGRKPSREYKTNRGACADLRCGAQLRALWGAALVLYVTSGPPRPPGRFPYGICHFCYDSICHFAILQSILKRGKVEKSCLLDTCILWSVSLHTQDVVSAPPGEYAKNPIPCEIPLAALPLRGLHA